jgi:Putative metallopeptidase
MTAPKRNPAAGIAAGVALAALAATPALAQSQDAARTLANGESIVIDGRTFSITPGTSKNDVATPSEQLGARPLGAGVKIFRRGDSLYMVDRAPPPPTATTADAPASGRPRADGPRNSPVECGRGYTLRDQGAYAPPNPNEECQRIFGLRDMERQRPFGPRDAAVDRERPDGLRDADIAPDDIAHMDENPRIHIEYQTPKDPAQQNVYDTVKQRHMLEMVRKIFSPFILGDIDLNIRTVSCGVSNAWYQRIDNVPTVSICYEYLQEIWQSMPEETKEVMGVTMKDTVCGQLFFAVAHELGHAMFDIFDVPVFGRQEDAADEFATYMMLQFGGEQALQLIDGAAYGYHAYVKDLRATPEVTLPLAAFSSDHGTPEERYFNLICIAYGYDPRLFSIEMDKIPPSRAERCKFEYADIKFAMRTVFWPHLDHEKVRRVLAMKWFIDANANTSKAD